MKRLDKAKRTIKEFWRDFLKVLRRPDMILLPGNLSFFFVLAIIPTFSLISYGASLLNLSVDFLYNFLATSFSKDIADIILGVNIGLSVGVDFFLTLLVGLYIASNSADSIITTSNTIYGIENNSWLKRRVKAFFLSFLIVVLLIFMLIVPVFGNTIINLFEEVNLNSTITNQIITILNLLKGPISWLIIFIIIKVIYAYAPDKKRKNRVLNYGALFTTIGFIIGTKIYSMYVTHYASYTALYGSLASIVVLMIWIYFLSYIFTIGIALNYEKDESNMSKNGIVKDK